MSASVIVGSVFAINLMLVYVCIAIHRVADELRSVALESHELLEFLLAAHGSDE